MGSFSMWQWLIVLLFFGIVLLVPIWKIVSKADYSGAWSLLLFVPLLNMVALWVFAFSEWPNAQRRA